MKKKPAPPWLRKDYTRFRHFGGYENGFNVSLQRLERPDAVDRLLASLRRAERIFRRRNDRLWDALPDIVVGARKAMAPIKKEMEREVAYAVLAGENPPKYDLNALYVDYQHPDGWLRRYRLSECGETPYSYSFGISPDENDHELVKRPVATELGARLWWLQRASDEALFRMGKVKQVLREALAMRVQKNASTARYGQQAVVRVGGYEFWFENQSRLSAHVSWKEVLTVPEPPLEA